MNTWAKYKLLNIEREFKERKKKKKQEKSDFGTFWTKPFLMTVLTKKAERWRSPGGPVRTIN